MKYVKRITADDWGSVTASVVDARDGRRCGEKWWMYRVYFETNAALAARLERAHRWADERIRVLEDGERA